MTRKARILCVDDDPDTLVAITGGLDVLGFETRCARSGEEAVEALLREGADVVVLDLGLPGMDGIATCRALKTIAGESFLPVLFLTGSTDLATRVRVLDAGGDDFCAKPFVLEELGARVRVCLRRLARERALELESRSFRGLAFLDALTELGNRRAFDTDLAREWARYQRHGRSLALLLADVDRFKRVNDTFGHAAGDTLLRSVGRSISQVVRQSDSAYRQGGDEFAVIMPETDAAGAFVVAERLRQVVSLEAPRTAGPISLSIGVAVAGDAAAVNASDLVAAADRALYAAKQAGRDRVVAAGVGCSVT
jgi:two-component system, cell cycle response regulator